MGAALTVPRGPGAPGRLRAVDPVDPDRAGDLTRAVDLTRAGALARDAADPLAALRDDVVVGDESEVYLDGNSLGRLPRSTAPRLARLVEEEWGRALVGSWPRWLDRPREVGDLLGEAVLGAAPGQVVVADTVTLHLYRLGAAAVAARP